MKAILALLAALFPSVAMASSDDAWAELFAKAKAACIKVSDLKSPQLIAKPSDFEFSALVLVKGISIYGGAKAAVACLYDKKTEKTQKTEIELSGWK